MPAQGRGANIDTSRRASSVNRTASRRTSGAGTLPRGVPPSESENYKNAQFGPRPGYRSGVNERNKPLTRYQYKVKTNSGDLHSEWRGDEKSWRPVYVKPTGGVEAPHPAPFRTSGRTGPFERGQRRS